ncbi:MAG: GntR family transcriptional regulator [candidate division GAL15 bacterium]
MGLSTAATRPAKYREAYRLIQERILRGQLRPGQRVIIDVLARELGMSPTPIREALRQLEAEGVVVYRPHAGARVADVNARAYAEVVSVRAVLEGWATALGAPRARAQLQRLRSLNARMREAVQREDLGTFDRLNRRFHRALYAGCGNRLLRELLENLRARTKLVRQSVFPFIPHRAWESVQEHDQLLDLLQAGAGAEEVEAFARQHKLRTLQAYLRWKAAQPASGARGDGGGR